MAVSELEMTSKLIVNSVIKGLIYEKENLNVFIRDHFNNESCSSRSSVSNQLSKTEESLQIPSNPNPIDPKLTNPNPFNNPGQPENPSRNEIMGASSLVQFWETKSFQQPSSSQSQTLIENRANSGFSNSENSILCSESITESEKEGFRVIDIVKKLNNNIEIKTEEQTTTTVEGRCYLPQFACTPMWLKSSQEATDFYEKLISDRINYLNWLASQFFVSNFSPRIFRFLQSTLRIRSLERCREIQNGYKDISKAFDVSRSGVMHLRSRYEIGTEKGFAGMVNSAVVAGIASSSVSSGVKKMCRIEDKCIEKSVLQETSDLSEIQEAICEAKIEKKSVLSEDLENKNGLKKVNPWSYKEKGKEEEETLKKEMEIAERNKERAMEEEVRSFVEAQTMEIEDRISLQYRRNQEETVSQVSKENNTEKISSQDNEETSNCTEELCINQESETFVNDQTDEEEEEVEYEDSLYNDDWVYEISQPRSYWEDLRKERFLEFMNKECSEKQAIIQLDESKQVSKFLDSEYREMIDKVLISHPQRKTNHVEDDDDEEEEDNMVPCLASNQERVEENEVEREPEKIDPEIVTESDDFSQCSWTFKDQGIGDTAASPSASSEICDLKKQIEELQREMSEVKNTVKSFVDFQESCSGSVSDPRKRKCCVCFKVPVDSLLYRCGHMCTCLKCGHELQWSSGKCPICLASIVDVVRVFLDF